MAKPEDRLFHLQRRLRPWSEALPQVILGRAGFEPERLAQAVRELTESDRGLASIKSVLRG